MCVDWDGNSSFTVNGEPFRESLQSAPDHDEQSIGAMWSLCSDLRAAHAYALQRHCEIERTYSQTLEKVKKLGVEAVCHGYVGLRLRDELGWNLNDAETSRVVAKFAPSVAHSIHVDRPQRLAVRDRLAVSVTVHVYCVLGQPAQAIPQIVAGVYVTL